MTKEKYRSFCDSCVKWLFPIAMAICSVMLLVAIIHVIMRYVFKSPLSWSEEFLRFAIVWFTMISAAILHHNKGHIGLIIFRDMLPRKLRAFCIRVVPFMAVIATASVAVNGILLLFKTYKQITPALNISVAIPYAAIPIGCFFMTLFGIGHILEISLSDKLPEKKTVPETTEKGGECNL